MQKLSGLTAFGSSIRSYFLRTNYTFTDNKLSLCSIADGWLEFGLQSLSLLGVTRQSVTFTAIMSILHCTYVAAKQ